MLLQLRKLANTWGAKILLFGVLILAFGIWGIADVFTPNQGQETVIQIGDQEIDTHQLQQAFLNDINRFNLQNITPEQAVSLGLMQVTVNRLINENLIGNESINLNLNIAEETIKKASEHEPAFQNASGQFDRDRFHFALANACLNEQTYIRFMRQAIARNWLQNALVSSVKVAKPFSEHLASWRGEKRAGIAIQLKWDEQILPEKLSESSMITYFNKNKQAFEICERRNIEIIVIEPSSFVDQINVTEEELIEEYETREDEFTTIEQREFNQYLTQTLEEAQKIYHGLQRNLSHDEIASTLDQRRLNYTEIGAVTIDEIPGVELAEAAFKLQKSGDFTKPIKNPFGWVILYLSKFKPAEIVTFEEAKTGLENQIKLTKAQDFTFEMANRFQDALASGSTLSEVAKQLSLDLRTIESIESDGFDKNGDQPLANLPDSSALLSQLFTLEPNVPSALIELETGYYTAGSVISIEPPKVPELEDIRAEVTKNWHQSLQKKQAQQKAVEIVTEIKALDDSQKLEAISKYDHSFNIEPTSRFELNEDDQSSNKNLNIAKQALFHLNQHKVKWIDSDDSTLVVLWDHVETSDQQYVELIDTTKTQYLSALTTAIVDDYLKILRQNQGVAVNENAINQLYAQ
ncbi:MAG: SurA N-terminal domain-containing protein [Pseudomonadota bacterium]